MSSIKDFIKNKDIEVFHYSRHGDDIKHFDNYDNALHPFDSIGLHVGNLKSCNVLFDRWKDRGTSGGVMYPLNLKSKKPLLNEDGSIMTEQEVHKFLQSIADKMVKKTGLMEYSDLIRPHIREMVWEEYDSIPYINSVEAAGEISYICPAESLSFRISPNLKAYKEDYEIIEQYEEFDIYDSIQQSHRNEDDFWDGDLGERIEEYKYYNLLKDFDLRTLDKDEWIVDEDLVEDYEKLIKEKGIKNMPPIVISDYSSIIDGIHRLNALLNQGYIYTSVLIGTNQKLEVNNEIKYFLKQKESKSNIDNKNKVKF